MNFSNFKNPETKRLLLKPTDLDDVDLVFALRSNPMVRKYISQPLYTEKEQATAHITKLISYFNKNKSISWTLVDKVSNEKLGSICLWNFSEDKKTAEVGYDLLPEYFKKGFMSEALQAVINFGFNTLKINTIEAFTHFENKSSIHLLSKNDFTLQPTRKDPSFPNNRIYTLVRFY